MTKNKQTINSLLSSIMLFIGTLSMPVKSFFDSGIIVYVLTIILVLAYVINNGVNLRIVFHLFILTIIFLLNTGLFGYFSETLEVYSNFLKFGFIYYWFFSNINDPVIFSKIYFKISLISIFIILFYIIFMKIDINYMSVGVDMTFALIATLFYLYVHRDTRFKMLYIVWSISLIVLSMVYGNRMSLISMVLVFLYYIVVNDTTANIIKRIFKYITITFLGTLIIIFYKTMLDFVWNFLIARGVTSYSLYKLKYMIDNNDIDVVSSGRDTLYSFAIESIKNSYGLPKGIGYFRANTDFLYPHNFILELFLNFGILTFPILILGIIILIVKIKKCQKRMKFLIISLLIFSLSRLFVSSSFWMEPSLWIAFGLLYANNKEEKNE